MGKGQNIWERLTLDTDLIGEPMPGQFIVEMAGDSRVLVENHRGVRSYSAELILVGVKCGCVRVSGNGLEIIRMTKDQLVIQGRIDGVTLQRRR